MIKAPNQICLHMKFVLLSPRFKEIQSLKHLEHHGSSYDHWMIGVSKSLNVQHLESLAFDWRDFLVESSFPQQTFLKLCLVENVYSQSRISFPVVRSFLFHSQVYLIFVSLPSRFVLLSFLVKWFLYLPQKHIFEVSYRKITYSPARALCINPRIPDSARFCHPSGRSDKLFPKQPEANFVTRMYFSNRYHSQLCSIFIESPHLKFALKIWISQSELAIYFCNSP